MKKLRISAIVEQDDNGFYAYCPQLKGCHSQGDSLDEALANLKEATALYMESLSSEEIAELHLDTRQILTTSLELSHA